MLISIKCIAVQVNIIVIEHNEMFITVNYCQQFGGIKVAVVSAVLPYNVLMQLCEGSRKVIKLQEQAADKDYERNSLFAVFI